ncbi:MAG: DNA-binding protein [Geodermatophilaceae bacterium]|nr:DNA-binding protein [Geodermatophilaceae bacterium]
MAAALTREEVLVLPAVIDVVTAGRALGLGRALTHELVRRGEFPVPVLRVGHVYRVPTAGVLKLLALLTTADNTAEHIKP